MKEIEKILEKYPSVEKLYSKYIGGVIKEKVELDIKGQVVELEPPKRVTISPSFYYSDSCVSCGMCCMNFDLIITEERYKDLMADRFQSTVEELELPQEKIEELKQVLRPIELKVDGKKVTMYSAEAQTSKLSKQMTRPNGKKVDQCRWLFTRENGLKHCSIYPYRSITCKMPHFEIATNTRPEKRTYLRTQQFGRYWLMGCPIKFGEFTEEAVQLKIDKLEELLEATESLGIETHIPEILKQIRFNMENNLVPQEHQIIWDSEDKQKNTLF